MFKRLTTLTIATGTTVFAASLFAADNSVPAVTENVNVNVNATTLASSNAPATAQEKYQLVSDMAHPSAPTMNNDKPTDIAAPSAPSGPFSEAENKQEKQSSEPAEAGTEKAAPPSGLFKEEALTKKPSAPQQPVLAENAEKTEEKAATNAAPTEPVPVAPKAVSMNIAPQVEKNTAENGAETPATNTERGYSEPIQISPEAKPVAVTQQLEAPTINAPVKPKAPEAMEKPTEMVAPEPQSQQAEGGNTRAGNTSSSMTMPTMNMNMPNIKMPSVNMNMPTTSMGTKVSPQAVEIPVPVQPAEQTQPAATPAQPTTER